MAEMVISGYFGRQPIDVMHVSATDSLRKDIAPGIEVGPQSTSAEQSSYDDLKLDSNRYHIKYFPKAVPWDPHRPVKIAILGAGIGGVASAILISRKVRNASIAVYDRLSKIGGTWAANVYPGVRCDVPSHVYQLSFAPNTQWSEYYPRGSEIQQYYESLVEKYGLTSSFHLEHQVLGARWLQETSQWAVEVRDLKNGNINIDIVDFFVSAQGRISEPSHPSISGLYDNFGGDVIHTALWPAGLDIRDKKVAVIGNGASGQQLIPNIIAEVKSIDHYVRTKTWVSPTFTGSIHEAKPDVPGGPVYSREEKRAFDEDPKAYLEHRREFELKFHQKFGGDVLGSKRNNELRERIISCMRERLGNDEEWLARVLPDYAPGCKRLTPAPGYLEALKNPKVDYVTTTISRVSREGIVTTDGILHPVDTIITATGFKDGFTSRIPIIGPDGVNLRDKWARDGEIGYPATYLGVMAPGYPNYFTVLQAQGNARGGSVPLHIEVTATFIAKCIRKVQSQSYSSLDSVKEAAEEFNRIVNGWFDDKVTTDRCNSWFKQGEGNTRVLISWPGSYHHRADILRDPRWEDFRFTRQPGAEVNRFEYFGSGSTKRGEEGDPEDLTKYLHSIPSIDIEAIHELWNE